MTAAPPVIDAQGVTRLYGRFMALNEVTVRMDGGVLGLLGPNGAGKSTFMKLVTGQIRPTSGRLTVLGHAPFTAPALRRHLGVVPELDAFYEDMTGRQFVAWLLRLAEFTPADAAARAAAALDEVGLTPHADKPIARYSKGMRQKTKLAQAVAHDPRLLVLDEPLTGADPISRRDILAAIRRRVDAGTAVLMSSHVLYEIEALTRDILLIHRGRILAEGNIEDLRALMDTRPRRLFVTADRPRELGAALAADPAVAGLDFRDASTLVIHASAPDAVYDALPRAARALGVRVTGLTSPDDSLEHVFNLLLEGR